MSADEDRSRDPLERLWQRSALGTLLASFAALALLVLTGFRYRVAASGFPIEDLQLAGSAARALEVLAKAGQDGDGGAIDNALDAIAADWWLIAAYVVSGSAWASFGHALFVSRTARLLARAAIAGVVVAGLSDIVENFALRKGISQLADVGDSAAADKAFQIASQAATFKFCLLALVAPVVLFSGVTVWKRVCVYWSPFSSSEAMKGRAEDVLTPWRTVNERGESWPEGASSTGKSLRPDKYKTARHAYGKLIPSGRMTPPPDRPACDVGFCVSGGGIRSACFTLGILQVLRDELVKARYLVSVSGGGYLVGAMQLALAHPAQAATQSLPLVYPSDVYGEGSMEEDHTRRHGDYLADGAGQWLVASGHVLRGAVGSFAVISATVFTLGLALSYFYDAIPLIAHRPLRLTLINVGAGARRSYPAPLVPIGSVLPWIIGTAALAWLISLRLLFVPRFPKRWRWLRVPWESGRKSLQVVSAGLLIGTGVVAFFVYVLPAVMWLATYPATTTVGDASELTTPERVTAGAGGTLLFTYLGALVAILGRGRKAAGAVLSRVKGVTGKGDPDKPGRRKLSGGLIQRVIVWGVLLLLAASNLLLLGVVAIKGVDWDEWLYVPVGLALVWWVVDQTWMSLHPFYRRRLSSAFSVRRIRLEGGDVAAKPYHFGKEATPLSSYGKRVAGFPQVIFACAANLSGQNRTAPGRRAVSYTLSHDYIGGADVGWIPTDLAESVASGSLRADLTVQAAMAISGAAFASAMGTQSAAYQRILALSNARLGTWLPNPVYFHALAQIDVPWWRPGLPRIRRLTYFFREILGSYPEDNRLLLITDGGHYDNLGLIELLRHKCRTVYCIDSGGDPPPFPQSLSEAITQARAELGVQITFKQEDINALLVGSGRPKDFPAAIEPILPRLSAKSVAIGQIEYPESFKLPGEREKSEFGKIIFAKSLITPEMSGELYAYCAARPDFPRDPTGDQWFTGAQFNAYQALGRFVGQQVKDATNARRPDGMVPGAGEAKGIENDTLPVPETNEPAKLRRRVFRFSRRGD